MDLNEKLFLEEVPEEDLKYVRVFRKVLKDFADKNELKLLEENTDLELYLALLTTASEIANDIGRPIEIKQLSEIPWNILSTGATIQLLSSLTVHSARNTFTYNDAGGVNVQETDVYGRYINIYNVSVAKYQNAVRNWKISKNAEACYGGVSSEYYVL